MQGGKRRILCAESNKDVRDLITLLLERKGYAVESVQTAAECLKLVATERFDLYILNDHYLDADSLSLCRKLREIDPATPVLLFSLDSSGHHAARAREAGAQFYLSQTSDFVALVQTIEKLMHG